MGGTRRKRNRPMGGLLIPLYQCYLANMDKIEPAGEWAVADAKNRFSELITKALTEGPQRVTRRGESVVVISAKRYEELRPRKNFIEHLLSAPTFEGVDLTRDPSPGRRVDFDDPS